MSVYNPATKTYVRGQPTIQPSAQGMAVNTTNPQTGATQTTFYNQPVNQQIGVDSQGNPIIEQVDLKSNTGESLNQKIASIASNKPALFSPSTAQTVSYSPVIAGSSQSPGAALQQRFASKYLPKQVQSTLRQGLTFNQIKGNTVFPSLADTKARLFGDPLKTAASPVIIQQNVNVLASKAQSYVNDASDLEFRGKIIERQTKEYNDSIASKTVITQADVDKGKQLQGLIETFNNRSSYLDLQRSELVDAQSKVQEQINLYQKSKTVTTSTPIQTVKSPSVAPAPSKVLAQLSGQSNNVVSSGSPTTGFVNLVQSQPIKKTEKLTNQQIMNGLFNERVIKEKPLNNDFKLYGFELPGLRAANKISRYTEIGIVATSQGIGEVTNFTAEGFRQIGKNVDLTFPALVKSIPEPVVSGIRSGQKSVSNLLYPSQNFEALPERVRVAFGIAGEYGSYLVPGRGIQAAFLETDPEKIAGNLALGFLSAGAGKVILPALGKVGFLSKVFQSPLLPGAIKASEVGFLGLSAIESKNLSEKEKSSQLAQIGGFQVGLGLEDLAANYIEAKTPSIKNLINKAKEISYSSPSIDEKLNARNSYAEYDYSSGKIFIQTESSTKYSANEVLIHEYGHKLLSDQAIYVSDAQTGYNGQTPSIENLFKNADKYVEYDYEGFLIKNGGASGVYNFDESTGGSRIVLPGKGKISQFLFPNAEETVNPQDLIHEVGHKLFKENPLYPKIELTQAEINADFLNLSVKKDLGFSFFSEKFNTFASYGKEDRFEESLVRFASQFPEELINPTTETGKVLSKVYEPFLTTELPTGDKFQALYADGYNFANNNKFPATTKTLNVSDLMSEFSNMESQTPSIENYFNNPNTQKFAETISSLDKSLPKDQPIFVYGTHTGENQTTQNLRNALENNGFKVLEIPKEFQRLQGINTPSERLNRETLDFFLGGLTGGRPVVDIHGAGSAIGGGIEFPIIDVSHPANYIGLEVDSSAGKGSIQQILYGTSLFSQGKASQGIASQFAPNQFSKFEFNQQAVETGYESLKRPEEYLVRFAQSFPQEILNPTTKTGSFLADLYKPALTSSFGFSDIAKEAGKAQSLFPLAVFKLISSLPSESIGNKPENNLFPLTKPIKTEFKTPMTGFFPSVSAIETGTISPIPSGKSIGVSQPIASSGFQSVFTVTPKGEIKQTEGNPDELGLNFVKTNIGLFTNQGGTTTIDIFSSKPGTSSTITEDLGGGASRTKTNYTNPSTSFTFSTADEFPYQKPQGKGVRNYYIPVLEPEAQNQIRVATQQARQGGIELGNSIEAFAEPLTNFTRFTPLGFLIPSSYKTKGNLGLALGTFFGVTALEATTAGQFLAGGFEKLSGTSELKYNPKLGLESVVGKQFGLNTPDLNISSPKNQLPLAVSFESRTPSELSKYSNLNEKKITSQNVFTITEKTAEIVFPSVVGQAITKAKNIEFLVGKTYVPLTPELTTEDVAAFRAKFPKTSLKGQEFADYFNRAELPPSLDFGQAEGTQFGVHATNYAFSEKFYVENTGTAEQVARNIREGIGMKISTPNEASIHFLRAGAESSPVQFGLFPNNLPLTGTPTLKYLEIIEARQVPNEFLASRETAVNFLNEIASVPNSGYQGFGFVAPKLQFGGLYSEIEADIPVNTFYQQFPAKSLFNRLTGNFDYYTKVGTTNVKLVGSQLIGIDPQASSLLNTSINNSYKIFETYTIGGFGETVRVEDLVKPIVPIQQSFKGLGSFRGAGNDPELFVKYIPIFNSKSIPAAASALLLPFASSVKLGETKGSTSSSFSSSTYNFPKLSYLPSLSLPKKSSGGGSVPSEPTVIPPYVPPSIPGEGDKGSSGGGGSGDSGDGGSGGGDTGGGDTGSGDSGSGSSGGGSSGRTNFFGSTSSGGGGSRLTPPPTYTSNYVIRDIIYPKKKKPNAVPAFDLFVKRRKKLGKNKFQSAFVKENKNPFLTYNEAVALGTIRTDQPIQQSFQVKQNLNLTQARNYSLPASISKFYQSKKNANVFIEKRKFAIDTQLEKLQLKQGRSAKPKTLTFKQPKRTGKNLTFNSNRLSFSPFSKVRKSNSNFKKFKSVF